MAQQLPQKTDELPWGSASSGGGTEPPRGQGGNRASDRQGGGRAFDKQGKNHGSDGQGGSHGSDSYNGPRIVGGDLETRAGSGSVLRDALLDISTVRGRDALLSPHVLEKELRKRGCGEAEIFRLCLLSRVRGYGQLVEGRSGQYDVERFVRHALAETGLRRDVVLDLAGTLASLSGPSLQESGDGGKAGRSPRLARSANTKPETLVEGGAVFPIPVGFYQEELDGCREAFRRAIAEGTIVSPDALARLRPLALAGIPEARYYLGAYLLRRSKDAAEDGDGAEEALDLLRLAAADGEPNAAAALGDFYYARRHPGDWAEAFRRYTGFGALALTHRRRIALIDILNQRNLNRKLFRYGGALLAVLVLLFLVPAGPLYSSGWIWSGVFALLGGGLFWAGVRQFQREPYGEYYAVPAALMGLWTLCWMVRVLLS